MLKNQYHGHAAGTEPTPLFATDAEIALREAIWKISVAEGLGNDAPKLDGEEREPDLFAGESNSSDSIGNGPITI